MHDGWLVPHAVFDRGDLRKGVALRVDDGYVTSVAAGAPLTEGRRLEGIVAPGYLDLQVNGGGGVLVNAQPTAEAMERIADTHRRFGTAGILPTVITDAPEVLESAVQAALDSANHPGVLGLHIEGPHIAVSRRGAHEAKYVRPMDSTTIDHVCRLRNAGVSVLITVAPEAVTPNQIGQLAETGAVVSIGHSDASAEDTFGAFDAGAVCVTHLFNAMSQMRGREPGVVGAAINSDVYAGLIVDGIHVDDGMIGLAIRARRLPDRMFLVSDAMPTVGGPDSFLLYGRKVALESGRLVKPDGTLAGAHLALSDAVVRLVRKVGVDRQSALRMGISVPAGVMGMEELARVEGRALSDLMLLDDDMAFRGWLDQEQACHHVR